MSKKKPAYPLYHWRYWPTWVAIGCMRLMAFLPYSWVLRLGPALGRLYAHLMPKRRKIAKINIDACFPERSAHWRQQLLNRQFENLGTSLLEVPLSWWGSPRRMRPLAHIHGLENLQQAIAQGKGVLLLSAHFNTPEIGGRLLTTKVPFWAMYRPSNDRVMDYVINRARKRWVAGIIARHDVRQVIRTLKRGGVVWYAVDQNTARKESVFVDFFSIPASTNTATARLARVTGALVVPFVSLRRADGQGHDLYLEPAWHDFPSGDLYADTQRVNDWVEAWVRRAPEQYLWIHRRFRTRPQRSDPPFYSLN